MANKHVTPEYVRMFPIFDAVFMLCKNCWYYHRGMLFMCDETGPSSRKDYGCDRRKSSKEKLDAYSKQNS